MKINGYYQSPSALCQHLYDVIYKMPLFKMFLVLMNLETGKNNNNNFFLSKIISPLVLTKS